MAIWDDARDCWPSFGKFDSRRAAIAWIASLDGSADAETGSTEWDAWVARIGRTLVFTDDRGFVWATKHASEDLARETFEEIETAYGRWDSGAPDHDGDCQGCEHDCPWQGNPIGAPYCQVCDDHAENAYDAEGDNNA